MTALPPHDFLKTFPDPIGEAKFRLTSGDIQGAQRILQPILQDIEGSGEEPTPDLQSLLEEITLEDARLHGIQKTA